MKVRHPESRGGNTSRLALAATALVSLAITSSERQTTIPQVKAPESIQLDTIGSSHAIHYASWSTTIFQIEQRLHNRLVAASRAHTTTSPPLTTTTTAPPTLTPEQIAASEVTPAEFAAWSKVAVCETGGNWSAEGPIYSGGLGIANTNWIAYGGGEFAPNAGQATPDEQIVVAMRIQTNPPDQNGCSGSW